MIPFWKNQVGLTPIQKSRKFFISPSKSLQMLKNNIQKLQTRQRFYRQYLFFKSSEFKSYLNIKNLLNEKAIRNKYNPFYQMHQGNDYNIFFEEKLETSVLQSQQREQEGLQSIPYLKKGDSNVYVDQFLAKEEEVPNLKPVEKQEPIVPEPSSSSGDESFEVSESGKLSPSAFHNFQKHLTVCLKHCIQIAGEEKVYKDYQIAASKLWKIFKSSSVSTKKILHFLLGQKNEHKITDQGLRDYGMNKIQELYGEKVLREARIYLAKEALRQIKEGKLDAYLNSKKLKDKEKFRRYVQIFIEELQNGYLRKRLPKDKVAYLQKA